MSHPYWPQSKFAYRPRRWAPVPQMVGGFGGFGAFTRGSMGHKTPLATPRYVAEEPDGVDGFGAFGDVPTNCLGALHTKIVDGIVNAVPGVKYIPGVAGFIEGIIGGAESELFKGLATAVLAGGSTLTNWVADNIRVSTGNQLIDSAISPGNIAVAIGQLQGTLKSYLDACASGAVSGQTGWREAFEYMCKNAGGTPRWEGDKPVCDLAAAIAAQTVSAEQSACEAKLTTTEWNAGYFCDAKGLLKQTGADGVDRWVVDAAVIAKINARIPQYVGQMQLQPIDPRKLVPTVLPKAPGTSTTASTVKPAAGGGTVLLLGGAAALALLLMRKG